MRFYSLFCIIFQFYTSTSIKIKPKLKKNILNFGYKYEGMLAHSFDRYYVVTKFIFSTIRDLKFSKLDFDDTCAYTDNKCAQNTESRKHMLDLKTFCKIIKPFVIYYKRLLNSDNNTGYNILEKEIKLLLPQVQSRKNVEFLPYWYQVLQD